MRVFVQRVKNGSVEIENNEKREIGKGIVALLGITHDDNFAAADYLVDKLVNLRIFEDENEKMNFSLKDIKGDLMIISQFTLYGDCKKGKRPSFEKAAKPETALPLYQYFVNKCKEQVPVVQTGEFGANMLVNISNDGPVTLLLEK